jgi:hypothetical protein
MAFAYKAFPTEFFVKFPELPANISPLINFLFLGREEFYILILKLIFFVLSLER